MFIFITMFKLNYFYCQTRLTDTFSGIMKKIEFQFVSSKITSRASESADLELNNSLHKNLNTFKNQITSHYKNKMWDSLKKYTNPYELVNKAPLPVSRSYFKLWEIMTDHMFVDKPMVTLFLAEGPGGFVESFFDFCKVKKILMGRIYCNTLISRHKNVPVWKIPTPAMQEAVRNHQLEFVHGIDGSGDIYLMDNIDDIVKTLQEGADLVTADGGFDFSSDFASQESKSILLITSEIYIGLRACKKGGVFIIKLFDVSLPETIALVHILNSSFASITVTKPMTSRAANSEKYIVCKDFVGTDQCFLDVLNQCITKRDTAALSKLTIPLNLIQDIERMNSYMIAQQIKTISKTIALINIPISNTHLNDCIDQQRCNAARWRAHYFCT